MTRKLLDEDVVKVLEEAGPPDTWNRKQAAAKKVEAETEEDRSNNTTPSM